MGTANPTIIKKPSVLLAQNLTKKCGISRENIYPTMYGLSADGSRRVRVGRCENWVSSNCYESKSWASSNGASGWRVGSTFEGCSPSPNKIYQWVLRLIQCMGSQTWNKSIDVHCLTSPFGLMLNLHDKRTAKLLDHPRSRPYFP